MDKLNAQRFELIQKGFATTADIKRFVPCGYSKAKRIFDTIQNQVADEGLMNLDDRHIRTDRLVKHLGFTEKQVRDAYFAERRLA